MGIPKFFRWLSERYPLINQKLDETHEFDNFYLDMNGIIHQCTHPNDGEIVVLNLDEMFERMFHYTDRLYRIVRPRKVLFLAVDGVAPRAKMNQQRSRRFRSAKDAERALAEAVARGTEIPEGKHFDSNCITPGTEFMYDLSKRFKAWIKLKMSTDPAWQQGCDVIFSGPEAPGEGEHKIMDYVRAWRASPDWNPTVRHCMYGLDADLIMLGLVAHEPHFTLLREKMKWRGNKRRNVVLNGGVEDADEFELLEIALLRDMLYLEFKPQVSRREPALGRNSDWSSGSERTGGVKAKPTGALSFKYEAHRVVDDFVFMCMLVGNDFVPHLPHLDIAEGALNMMFRIYKELLPKWDGYLTKAQKLHPDRLEMFIQRLADAEPQYFENRSFEEDEPGFRKQNYREFYYLSKLNHSRHDEEYMSNLCVRYLEGLHWVLQYYHNGCQSWNWYYPYLYSPLASDMKSLRQHQIRFRKGKPFRPIEQLLAVLPPASAEFLPIPYQRIMAEDSPVAHYYPREFQIDMNGKRNAWEAVVSIPFIDEDRLLTEVRKIPKEELTPEELRRNGMGRDKIFYAKDFPSSKDYIPPVRPRAMREDRYRRRPNLDAGRKYMENVEEVASSSRSPARPPRSVSSSPRRGMNSSSADEFSDGGPAPRQSLGLDRSTRRSSKPAGSEETKPRVEAKIETPPSSPKPGFHRKKPIPAPDAEL